MIEIEYNGEILIVLGVTPDNKLLVTDKKKSVRFSSYSEFKEKFGQDEQIDYKIFEKMDYRLAAYCLKDIDETYGAYYLNNRQSDEFCKTHNMSMNVSTFLSFGGGSFIIGLEEHMAEYFGRNLYVIEYQGDINEIKEQIKTETERVTKNKIKLMDVIKENMV